MSTDKESDWLGNGIGLLSLVAPLIFIGIFVAVVYFIGIPMYNTIAEKYEPNGTIAQVQVLGVYMAHNIIYDSRTCIYEVEGTRHETGDCLYNEGDTITVYQTNGGAWFLKESESK